MSTEPTNKQTAHEDLRTFGDHIGELRKRVAWVALVFVVASAVAYNFRDWLIDIVLKPLGDQKLVYLTPAGGFTFIFQITLYVGAVVAAPLMVYHLYRFVQPALPVRARRYSLRIVVCASLLMIAGVCFGYFVAVPAALHFLTTFAGDFITPSLTADSYLSFIVAYVVGLGILFQLPLLLVFWNWISPMSTGKLLNSERYLVVLAFIAAAMITPTPDMLNQSLIAVPIILIYQLGVVAVVLINRRQRAAQAHRTKIMKLADISAKAPIRPAGQIELDPEPLAAQLSKPMVTKPMIVDTTISVRSGQLKRPDRPATIQPRRRPGRSTSRLGVQPRRSIDGVSWARPVEPRSSAALEFD
ncbi:MAG TPA: twin-arginine translocase subunit TatC [Candidatus Saccharimonadales bacterium]|nr:twin-arginine translocase subunit TatC [Candidatus Saccharimonadales bacterium]